MVLILVIGDLHIPSRAPSLPVKFKKLLVPGKIQQTICTGNITDRETYDFLRSVSPDIHIVKGDFDDTLPNLPTSKIITHGPLKIGVIHGHTLVPSVDPETLLIAAREMGVDVFIWGGTHRFEALELEGRFFINPGSATGAIASGYWAEGEEPVPSFMLMDLQGMSLVLYIYTLDNGQVKVEKLSYRKGES